MPKFFDVQIEKKVLTGMLQDTDALEYGVSNLSTKDFEEANISYLFDIINRFYSKYYKCITREILSNWLDKNDPKNKTTLLLLFTEIIALPFDTYYRYYINELKTYTLRRNLYTIHDRITKGLNTDEDPGALFSDLSRKILISNTPSTVHRTSVHDSIDDRIKLYKDKRDFPEKYQGVQYGMREVDELTGGMFSGQLYMVAGRSGAGKCVAGSSQLLMQDGTQQSIKEVVALRTGKILTLDKKQQLKLAQPSNYMYSGKQGVYELTTKSGRIIKVTKTHPLLTVYGWKQLKDLKVDDRLAVPRILSIFGIDNLPGAQVKLLAYSITEGNLTTSSIGFTNYDKIVRKDFEKTVQDCNLGSLDKKTTERTIPTEIFKLPKKKLAKFLGILWSCDGRIHGGRLDRITFETSSLKITEQVSHLLLRFGILTRYWKHVVMRNDKKIPVGSLEVIMSCHQKFLEEIGPHFVGENRKRVVKALEILKNETRDINVDTIPVNLIKSHLPFMQSNADWDRYEPSRTKVKEFAQVLNDKKLLQLATSDIFWDTIKSIEYVGVEDTYDLEMASTHNFIADDIIIHNSRWLFNIGCNVAKRQQTVMYCTIEMEAAIIQNMWESRETRIPLKKIMRAELDTEEEKRYLDFLQSSEQAKIPFYIVDIPQGCTTGMIDAEVATFEKIHGKVPDIVLIDYANLINPVSRFKDRAEKYDHVFRELKEGARAHKTPFYTAAQMNRESLKSKEPGTEHVAFSDAASYHCDAVFRVFADKNNDVENDIQLEVIKGRYHEKACISLYWGREINLIAEWGTDIVRIGEKDVDKDSNVPGNVPEGTTKSGSIENDTEEY